MGKTKCMNKKAIAEVRCLGSRNGPVRTGIGRMSRRGLLGGVGKNAAQQNELQPHSSDHFSRICLGQLSAVDVEAALLHLGQIGFDQATMEVLQECEHVNLEGFVGMALLRSLNRLQ